MKELLTKFVGIAVFLLGACGQAHATLIGDDIEISFGPIPPTQDIVAVGAGPEITCPGAFNACGPWLFDGDSIDVSDSSLRVDFGSFGDFDPGDFLLFDDLDWVGMEGFISGVSLITNMPDVLPTDISFTANSAMIDFDQKSPFDGAFVQIDLTVTHVPAPATLALFSLGLAGLGWSRRKNS